MSADGSVAGVGATVGVDGALDDPATATGDVGSGAAADRPSPHGFASATITNATTTTRTASQRRPPRGGPTGSGSREVRGSTEPAWCGVPDASNASARDGQPFPTRVMRDRVHVEGHTEPGPVGDRQHAVAVEPPRIRDDRIDVGGARQVLHEGRPGDGRRELEVGGKTDRRVPAVRHEGEAVVERHPGDAPRLADPADLGRVGLDDVERVALEPWYERLPSGQHLTAGYRYAAV